MNTKEEAIARLIEAIDYLGAPMAVVEIAKDYIRRSETWNDDFTLICRERAMLLLQCAHDMKPACCEMHRLGGDVLSACS